MGRRADRCDDGPCLSVFSALTQGQIRCAARSRFTIREARVSPREGYLGCLDAERAVRCAFCASPGVQGRHVVVERVPGHRAFFGRRRRDLRHPRNRTGPGASRQRRASADSKPRATVVKDYSGAPRSVGTRRGRADPDSASPGRRHSGARDRAGGHGANRIPTAERGFWLCATRSAARVRRAVDGRTVRTAARDMRRRGTPAGGHVPGGQPRGDATRAGPSGRKRRRSTFTAGAAAFEVPNVSHAIGTTSPLSTGLASSHLPSATGTSRGASRATKASSFGRGTAKASSSTTKPPVRGGLQLVPDGAAEEALAADYAGMVTDGLLFENAPEFMNLVAECREIQTRANQTS